MGSRTAVEVEPFCFVAAMLGEGYVEVAHIREMASVMNKREVSLQRRVVEGRWNI